MTFKAVPMAKIAIVGPKTRLEAAINELHNLNVLHIQDFAPGEEGFDLGSPLPHGSKVSERLLHVRGILKSANMEENAPAKRFTPQNLGELESKLDEVAKEISVLVDRRSGLQDRLQRIDEQIQALRRIRNLALPVELLGGYRHLAVAAGFVRSPEDVADLQRLDPSAEAFTSTEGEGTFVFVAMAKARERDLQNALTRIGFRPLEVPETTGLPADRLEALGRERVEVEAQSAEIEGKIAVIRERYGPAFRALDEYLSIEADKATAPVRLRTTHNAFMIEGWVPRNDLRRVRNRLDGISDGKIFLTELETPLTTPWKFSKPKGHGHDDEDPEEPPVQLSSPRSADAFKLLTDTYGRPRYTEFDPTLFFFIGFPFFYGMMLGDIAYGIILLLFVKFGVFTAVLRFLGFSSIRQINIILRNSAISSMLFGALYTEFFGFELLGPHGIVSHWETTILGPIPYPIARFENVTLLLMLAMAVAAIHLLIGLGVGLRNTAHQHGWRDAITHKASWICIMVAAVAALFALAPPLLDLGAWVPAALVTPILWTSLALVIVGCVLLVLGEGATALLEVPTVISNLLSYTRLVAIGLSSAGIAFAGNQVAAMVWGDGGVMNFVYMLLILMFFHGLNLILGVIGPALHSLRLHYVEFFTKFYDGGGTPYEPFGAQRVYTTKEVEQA